MKKTSHRVTPTLNVGDQVEYLDGTAGRTAVRGKITGFYGSDRVKVLTQTGNIWLLKRLDLKIIRRKVDSIKIG